MLIDLNYLAQKYGLSFKGVFHVGAHFGQENSIYKRLNIKNKIFFEPIPQTFQNLINNVNDGDCVNVALGNHIGRIEMFIETANQGQSSSILEPDIHLKQYPHIVFNDRIMVNITTLDSYIKENDVDINNYNFINIDVQGYELEVFKGAHNTLNKIDYIMSEVNRNSVYHNCCMVNEVDDFLGKYGFERVETNWAGNTWGDAFYIKNKLK